MPVRYDFDLFVKHFKNDIINIISQAHEITTKDSWHHNRESMNFLPKRKIHNINLNVTFNIMRQNLSREISLVVFFSPITSYHDKVFLLHPFSPLTSCILDVKRDFLGSIKTRQEAILLIASFSWWLFLFCFNCFNSFVNCFPLILELKDAKC